MPSDPRTRIARLESTLSLPPGTQERFSGYGLMGLPLRSGHVLAMRRFGASSVGPGYASVWHRSPDGAWSFSSTNNQHRHPLLNPLEPAPTKGPVAR